MVLPSAPSIPVQFRINLLGIVFINFFIVLILEVGWIIFFPSTQQHRWRFLVFLFLFALNDERLPVESCVMAYQQHSVILKEGRDTWRKHGTQKKFNPLLEKHFMKMLIVLPKPFPYKHKTARTAL